jgi:hypothetical protein
MQKSITLHVGLDVHKDSIDIAIVGTARRPTLRRRGVSAELVDSYAARALNERSNERNDGI